MPPDMHRVIVALDKPTFAEAVNLASTLDPGLCRVKVGKELFTAAGPAVVEALMKRGFEVFLDLKFHDIPNTVAGAIRSACGLGVWMTNVHCLGGSKMLKAAIGARDGCQSKTLIIGVTILTSLNQEDMAELEFYPSLADVMSRYAAIAEACELHGVVCSGQEAAMLRKQRGRNFLLVTPGIRLPGGNAGDQARTMTPDEAILAGADYLVVGRPITGAPDPNAVLESINDCVYSALCG